MTRFLFDIDGTLTDSRQKIDSSFEEFMLDFCLSGNSKVAFVTGSDRQKTVEQIGEKLFSAVDYSFNCSGNEIWHNGNLIHRHVYEPEQELLDYLDQLLDRSKFPLRTGTHMERRNGMINFTVVGRGCTTEERKEYVEWDKQTSERVVLRDKIAHRFENVDVFIAGDTGLDIFPKGKNKEQVIEYLRNIETETTYYFGDQIFPHGNDYNIAMKCDHRYSVKNWKNTYEILRFLEEARLI